MKLKLRGIRFRLPSLPAKVATPIKAVGSALNYLVTTLLVAIAIGGFTLAFVNPIQYVASYLPVQIGTLSITESLISTNVALLHTNFEITLGSSAGILFLAALLHIKSWKSWGRGILASPSAIYHSPVVAYRKAKVFRDWVLEKVNFLNEESAKWRRIFNIMKSPYSLMRAMGFSPQMAIGLLALGGTAGGGVIVNETILAERSFSRGDSGVYTAPSDVPTSFDEKNNTLRVVLGTTPVREIRIENVSVGTVFANSTLPANQTTAVLVGGVDVAGENTTDTFLEVGELVIEKSRCQTMDFTHINAHTINIIGNASDGQSINTSPGTSRMRAIGGGHHQAEAMVTNGGTYDRIHIDAPTSAVNGKIGRLVLSNLYTEGGACTFTRMKVGTLTVELNEVGLGNGFATKEFVIAQSVTGSNWNVTDNVEVSIGVPGETLNNE